MSQIHQLGGGFIRPAGTVIPVPWFEQGSKVAKTIVSGSSYTGSSVYARLPIFGPEIDISTLRLEFGYFGHRSYASRRTRLRRGRRMTAWSHWDGGTVVTGTGFGGGSHAGMPVRPNRLTFTGNDLIELAWENWFTETTYFGFDSQGNSVTATGVRTSFFAGDSRPSSVFNAGGGSYGKTPQRGATNRSCLMNRIEFHARIIEVDAAGRLVRQGAWSSDAAIVRGPATHIDLYGALRGVAPSQQFNVTIQRLYRD